MSLDVVNERSTAYLAVSFYDKAGALSAPTSITYTIRHENGTVIRGPVTVAASEGVEITLDTNDNAIINTSGKSEIHVVTITGTYGVNDAIVSAFRYQVNRIDAVT